MICGGSGGGSGSVDICGNNDGNCSGDSGSGGGGGADICGNNDDLWW